MQFFRAEFVESKSLEKDEVADRAGLPLTEVLRHDHAKFTGTAGTEVLDRNYDRPSAKAALRFKTQDFGSHLINRVGSSYPGTIATPVAISQVVTSCTSELISCWIQRAAESVSEPSKIRILLERAVLKRTIADITPLLESSGLHIGHGIRLFIAGSLYEALTPGGIFSSQAGFKEAWRRKLKYLLDRIGHRTRRATNIPLSPFVETLCWISPPDSKCDYMGVVRAMAVASDTPCIVISFADDLTCLHLWNQ